MSERRRYSSYETQRATRSTPKRRRRTPLAILLIVLIAVGVFIYHGHASQASAHAVSATVPTATTSKKMTPAAAKPVSECTKNTAGTKLLLVSIAQRHLWACDGTTQSYDSPVVTGMENLAADLTPQGTYHIYGKYVNTVLKGSDSTGSWDDPVSYWMPWLHNQYGSYGFHDATWRQPSDFGNIDPNSSEASHGCVELPLATAKWIYDWAEIGTTVTIEA